MSTVIVCSGWKEQNMVFKTRGAFNKMVQNVRLARWVVGRKEKR